MASVETFEMAPECRFALAYAGKRREAFAALFALDHRLARAAREASEPIIAQMKLAWWRDRFAQPVADWPKGEPLLQALSLWGDDAARLHALVDGWESFAVAGEAGGARDLIAGREAAWLGIAGMLDDRHAPCSVGFAAARYTLAALRDDGFGPPANLIAEAREAKKPLSLPRTLRPFALLGALGERALRTGRPLLGGTPALALALRVGLTGH